jgi:hypothetical protein
MERDTEELRREAENAYRTTGASSVASTNKTTTTPKTDDHRLALPIVRREPNKPVSNSSFRANWATTITWRLSKNRADYSHRETQKSTEKYMKNLCVLLVFLWLFN